MIVLCATYPVSHWPRWSSPRYDELFTLIQSELKRSGYEELIPAGVVLTGGTSKMEGAVELAEEIFHMPVRVGAPQYARPPRHHSQPDLRHSSGLLLYGAEDSQRAGNLAKAVMETVSALRHGLKNGSQNTFRAVGFLTDLSGKRFF